MCDIAGQPMAVDIIEFSSPDPKKDWFTIKPTTPTGTLPVLELEDGTKLSESFTCRYIYAAQCGMLGSGKDAAVSACLMALADQFWKGWEPYSMGNADNMGNVPNLVNISEDLVKMMGFEWPLWLPEKVQTATDHADGVVKFINEQLEPLLLPSGDKFTSDHTCGQITIFHHLDVWNDVYLGQDLIKTKTKLGPFMDYMNTIPACQNIKNGKSIWGVCGPVTTEGVTCPNYYQPIVIVQGPPPS